MVLVDTSSWTQALRNRGDPEVRERVEKLLLAGEAGWCDMVRLELWNGVRGADERKRLRELDSELTSLAIDSLVWKMAFAIARSARTAGLTVPNADLLIFSCARRHRAALEHSDKHFDALDKLVTAEQAE